MSHTLTPIRNLCRVSGLGSPGLAGTAAGPSARSRLVWDWGRPDARESGSGDGKRRVSYLVAQPAVHVLPRASSDPASTLSTLHIYPLCKKLMTNAVEIPFWACAICSISH